MKTVIVGVVHINNHVFCELSVSRKLIQMSQTAFFSTKICEKWRFGATILIFITIFAYGNKKKGIETC